MRIIHSCGVILLACCVPNAQTFVQAAEGDDLVGRYVIVCREAAAIYKEPAADSKLSNISPLALITRVRETRGGWVRADEGWFLAKDVVDVDRAQEFFTRAIEASPSGFAFASRSWATILCLGSLGDALEDAERAVARDSQCAIAFFARGECKHKQKSYQEAIDDFTRAIQLEPRFKVAYNDRAIATGMLGRYVEAIDGINVALRHWPNDRMLVCGRGSIYIAIGEYDKAINDFTDARKTRPSEAIDSSLAFCYRERGCKRLAQAQYELGIADLTEAIRLEPGVADAHMHRGEAYLIVGKNEAAAAIDLQEAVRLEPDSAEARAGLGQALVELGKLDDAIGQFNESIRLDGGENPATLPVTLRWRGRALHRRGKYAEAARDLERAIKLDPNVAFVHSDLGDSLTALGDFNRAIEAYSRAIDLDPKVGKPLYKRGFALGSRALATRNQGDFDRAIADCSAAIELEPTSADAYLTRGHVLSLDEQHYQAVADFTQAIAINPLLPIAYEARADEWLVLHEPARAIEDLTESLRISPNRPDVYLQRSEAWSLAGNRQKAAEDAAEAERLWVKLAESKNTDRTGRASAPKETPYQ